MQFRGSRRTNLIALSIVLVGALVVVTLTRDSYWLLILTLVPIWAVMGLSWNMLGGYLGLVSFGQAAFFGLGAFAVVIPAYSFDVTPWLGLPLATSVGALAGIVIGAITFRFKGFYFALAMLAYPLAMLRLFEWGGWNEVAIPMHRDSPWTFMQFEDPHILAYIGVLAAGLALAISLEIERSRFGLTLFAIRQDELAAKAAGLATYRAKLKAIALSGAMAGFAGGLYALALLVVTPSSLFGMLVSAQALIIPMFGGRGTAWGAVIGAIVLVPLSEALYAHLGASLPGIPGVIYGLAIIIVVMLIPEGLFWTLTRWFGRPQQVKLAAQASDWSRDVNNPIVLATGQKNTSSESLLEVEGLNISFGAVHALTNVSFKINAGELVGIIGPNGAGKTTLFNALNGIIVPNGGRILFDGHAILGRSSDDICRRGIARTFQTVRAFPHLTLLENVVTGSFARTTSDEQALGKAREVLSKVGLLHRIEDKASDLTARDLRLMELARALACEPQLLLLDECLAGLSTDEVEDMIKVLRHISEDKVTIIIIEHTMHAMVKLAHRLIVLDHGEVIASGKPKDVLSEPNVISAYLGRRWAEYAPS